MLWQKVASVAAVVDDRETMTATPRDAEPLRVVHVMRAPVVHNGLTEQEFEPAQSGAAPRLAPVGSGPDGAAFRALAQERGVAPQLSFLAPM
jgi:hypothetical protein